MEELNTKPIKRTPQRKALLAHAARLLLKRTRDEGYELLLSDLKEGGATDETVGTIRELRSIYEEHTKDEASFAFADRIILGGLLAINLVILQALISSGKPDAWFAVSLIALSISIPTAAGYLFSSFIRGEFKSKDYVLPIFKKFFSSMAFVSELTGLIGIVAAIWHVWWLAGLLFILICIIVGLICVIFFGFAGMRDVGMKRSEIIQATTNKSDWQATCSLINNARK